MSDRDPTMLNSDQLTKDADPAQMLEDDAQQREDQEAMRTGSDADEDVTGSSGAGYGNNPVDDDTADASTR